MGYAVHVDPESLTAGAGRIGRAAGTLEELAGRLLTSCAAAAPVAGGGELAQTLAEAARTTSVSVGRCAAVVGALGAATAASGADYRLLEETLTGRLGAGPAAGGVGRS